MQDGDLRSAVIEFYKGPILAPDQGSGINKVLKIKANLSNGRDAKLPV